MKFGTKERLKSETIAEAVALIAFSATFNSDRVGLLLLQKMLNSIFHQKKGGLCFKTD